jgi:hypothetical protein
MPYIKKEDRKTLDPAITQLTEVLVKKTLQDTTAMAGLLNYTFSRVMMGVIQGTGGVRYHKIAAVTGMLKNVADEFYRRIAKPYEDRQCDQNGDIPEYEADDAIYR